MKTKRKIYILALAFFILMTSPAAVLAACVLKPNSVTCPDGKNIITGNDGRQACATPNFSQNLLGEFVKRDVNDLKVCPKIAGDVTYTYKSVRDTGDSGGATLTRAVCCPGSTIPIRYWYGVRESIVCCNPSYTWSIGNTRGDAVANVSWRENEVSWYIEEKSSNDLIDAFSGFAVCQTQAGSQVQAEGDTDPVNAPTSQMSVPVDGWSCGGSVPARNCRLISGDPQDPDELFVTQQLCESNVTCVQHNQVLPSDSSKRCVNGQVVDATLPTLGPGTDPRGCESIDQARLPQEYAACIKCSQECETCVYSSLGCVDVSRDGLVTRVFQIGIGLIGGIMIIRFIQAALKMQTDNPEEIKEAQAMITSAILALLVLVGSVVILRFLGINVLGILPADFLQSSATPTATP